MNDATKFYRVERSQAEQFLARHITALGGPKRSDYRFHRAAVRRFLTDLCRFDEESARSHLILSERRLLDWLIGEARRRTTASAGACFATVSRYVRGLVQTGLLETDLMAAFQALYGSRGWPILAGALQAPDPVAALTLLQVKAPPSGPIALHAQSYLELHQATGKADIVREVLAGYQGVLVSDFYPGYDSLPCRQQKCLVHLIRDINDDLWKAPFDKELEAFAVAVQALLVPILVEVDRYGLKAWHLRKFLKDVERFYDKHIIGREYTSEPVRTFQKRFVRYRESLFMFLTQDGIPWENNMAERAIRQLAVEEDLGLVLQAVRWPLPAAAGYLADVPLPGQIVPQVHAVERNRLGLVPADAANSVLIRRRGAQEPTICSSLQ